MKVSNLTSDYHKIISTLQGSSIQNESDGHTIPKFCSFGTTLMKDVMNGEHKSLVGSDLESQCLIWQWIEHRIAAVSTSDLVGLLTYLNKHLESHVYIVNDNFSLADIVLFYALQSSISELSVFEKQSKYLNVTRWFYFIQQHDLIRPTSNVKISTNVNNKIYF